MDQGLKPHKEPKQVWKEIKPPVVAEGDSANKVDSDLVGGQTDMLYSNDQPDLEDGEFVESVTHVLDSLVSGSPLESSSRMETP